MPGGRLPAAAAVEAVRGEMVATESVEQAMCRAAACVLAGETGSAARLVDAALTRAAPGSAGWLLPIDPILDVQRSAEAWQAALARLRARAS